MPERSPVRDSYDAIVRVTVGTRSVQPFAIVKETWSIAPGRRPALTAPVPLVGDLHGGKENEERGGFAPGSDFWPYKAATDLIVEGSVWAPDGEATRALAEIEVAGRIKRVRGIGKRVLEWRNGRATISAPEPFRSIPLTVQNAYGGVDHRVPIEGLSGSLRDLVRASTDHPGLYPRNPHGRGYIVVPEEPEGQVVELPGLEDPRTPLTDENILVRDPRLWYRQPLPCFLGWSSPAQFPRLWFVGASPWFPVPESEELEEVRRGLLSPEWRTLVQPDDPIHVSFHQEASDGLVFAQLPSGTPVTLRGMHPEHRELVFEVPRAPKIELEVAGTREACTPHLLHLVVVPDELVVKATWVAWFSGDAPTFVPKLHAHIPVTVRVGGDAPIPCEAPPPIREQLKAAAAEGLIPHMPSILGTPSPEQLHGRVLPQRARRLRDQTSFDDALKLGSVDVVSGRVLWRAVDWTHPGTGLAWTRHYSSSMAWREGPLGLGWSHSFGQELWHEAGWILLSTEDGREIGMPVGGELGLGQSAHHPAFGITVRRVASDTYEVHSARGGHRRFVAMPVASTVAPELARAKLVGGVLVDGTRWSAQHDSHGRLAQVAIAGREVLRFEHDAAGRLARVYAITANGRDWSVGAAYSYDPTGLLRESRDAAGRVQRYAYSRRMLSRVRAGDEERVFEHEGSDRDARCVREKVGDLVRSIAFDGQARLAVCKNACGDALSVRVTPSFQVERVLDFFGNELVRTYDESSDLVTTETTRDGESSFLYDADYHVADVTHPARGSVALEHDERGRLVQRTGADHDAARWSWDELGRMIVATRADGTAIAFDRNENGVLNAVLAPAEVRLHLTLDAHSETIGRIVAPTGARTGRRDAQARIVEIEDELGHVTRVRYDASGRVAELTLPDGLVRTYVSDADGRVLEVRDATKHVRWERDASGRVTHVDEGGSGPTLHRDTEGRVTMVESEAATFWELGRDAAGRLVRETTFDDAKLFHRRDHRGAIVASSLGGIPSTVRRDAAGRPVELEHDDGSFQRFAWSPGGRLTHAQEADRRTALQHDGLGRPTLDTQDEHWARNVYGPAGRRTSLETSLGLRVRVERDVLGEAMSLRAEQGAQVLELRIERDAAGREIRRHIPGGLVVRSTRDALGRCVDRTLTSAERALSTLRFMWHGERLVRVEDPSRGARDHRHDARGRLVQVGGLIRVVDEVGNVFRSETRDDHRYGTDGRVLESQGIEYAYDELGQRVTKVSPLGDTTRYRWDALGRLIEVALSDDRRIVYGYDALGRRIRRADERKVAVPGLDEPVWEVQRETLFVWDGLELVHEVTDGEVVSWIWDSGRLVGVLSPRGAHAVLTDPLGCPTEILDAQGNVVWRAMVDAFGALHPELEMVSCPWRFPGHWEDPDTGLQHAWLRVYDPETGSYLTPSPLGLAGGTNLYAYVSDPMSESSPLGLGRGYAALAGELPGERVGAELLARIVEALDRGDGALGPRERFDRAAARITLPDPEALFWGPWARYRPSANLPPSTSALTRVVLPGTTDE
jgi:RHS repeat-associated protein